MEPAELRSNPIPFSYFCELLAKLRDIRPRARGDPWRSGKARAASTLCNWISHLRAVNEPVPAGTATLFFRLLFPEEGVRRRYNLREGALSRLLVNYFSTSKGRFDGWCSTTLNQRSDSSGCLGLEVESYLVRSGRRLPAREGGLMLGRVDELLDELASLSKFSAEEVLLSPTALRRKLLAREYEDIIKDLLDPLTAREIAFMIQIILRDLHPVLYSLPSLSGVVSLSFYNAMPYYEITLERALRAWSPRLPEMYRIVKDLDYVTRRLEGDGGTSEDFVSLNPVLGIPVRIPVSARPGTCRLATKELRNSVALETKYDGERLQIHVDMSLERTSQIKIFSKSGRDSTQTRKDLQPIIRAALGLDYTFDDLGKNPLLARRLGPRPSPLRHPIRKLIIEGEMVTYNEDEEKIDEFWTLAAVKHGHHEEEEEGPSQESYSTGATVSQDIRGNDSSVIFGTPMATQSLGRHLKIVWFDVIQINDRFLHCSTYQSRRSKLEEIVRPIKGFSMLADRIVIDFGSVHDENKEEALKALRLHFATLVTQRMEGLMLKPLLSKYSENREDMSWVKLKKDFIPGAGDTKDFNIVGVRWQRERGRKLNVPPAVYTTFYVGLRADHLGPVNNRASKPHYHIGFAASYGLDRNQLDQINREIRDAVPEQFHTDPTVATTFHEVRGRHEWRVFESACTTFTFTLADHLATATEMPTWILKKPRIVEMTGAGFQKAAGSKYYELRWPRITKTHREDGSPLDLDELQATAKAAMQMLNYEEPTATAWALVTNAALCVAETPVERFNREVAEWVRKLEKADRVAVEGQSGSLDAFGFTSRRGSEVGLFVEERGFQLIAKRRKLDTPVLGSMTNATHSPSPTGFPSRNQHITSQTHSSALRRETPVIVSIDSDPDGAPLLCRPIASSAPSSRPLTPPVPPATNPILSQRRKSAPTLSSRHLLSQGVSEDPVTTPRSSRRERSLRPRTSLGSSPSRIWEAFSSSPVRTTVSPFWSIFPPPVPTMDSTGAVNKGRHPDVLRDGNYLLDPMDIVWCSGRLREESGASRSHYCGTARPGFVFLGTNQCRMEAVQWLRARMADDRQGEAVYLLPNSCLQTVELSLDEMKQRAVLL